MRRPFRERNPIPIGAVGLVVMAAFLLVSFNAGSLVGGGRTYYANFSEAAGLKVRDKVRIAGVTVGQVQSIELQGAHVNVAFTVEGAEIGKETRATIKVGTVLGQKFLQLTPEGSGSLASGETIPLKRTHSPYDVIKAFSGLTKRTEDLDLQRLRKAINTISATFEGSAPHVTSTLRGLRRLSETIASRDQKLQELLSHAKDVTGVLSDRKAEFAKLLKDGNKLLREVRKRREVIHQLLINTVQLSDQLSALIEENQEQLRPALRHLDSVVKVLRRHQRDLARSLEMLEKFTKRFTDTLGSGQWFDVYIQNVVPVPTTVRTPRN